MSGRSEVSVERLWTPWRMQYVSHTGEAPAGCLFCELPKSEDDASNLLLVRGERAFALLNLYPYNTGHAMVAPYLHTADFGALPAEIASDLLALSQRLVSAILAEYRPDGFNLGMNLGRVAGAGVPDHLHLHIVPRWAGDTNFMPLTADTRVLPETLRRTYERLIDALRRD
jgi:ATP adenylyltransferase